MLFAFSILFLFLCFSSPPPSPPPPFPPLSILILHLILILALLLALPVSSTLCAFLPLCLAAAHECGVCVPHTQALTHWDSCAHQLCHPHGSVTASPCRVWSGSSATRVFKCCVTSHIIAHLQFPNYITGRLVAFCSGPLVLLPSPLTPVVPVYEISVSPLLRHLSFPHCH